MTPEQYTERYDAIVGAIHKVSPETKFVGLALSNPGRDERFFEYFLNPANHKPGIPLDMISYHFYASPASGETLDHWQYTFFDQEAGFLNTVRYVEAIRKRLSPNTMTDLDELGVILPTDNKPGDNVPPPAAYWNLAGALYADLFIELSRLQIDVVGESQLVGYPTQFPSVSMMDWTNESTQRALLGAQAHQGLIPSRRQAGGNGAALKRRERTGVRYFRRAQASARQQTESRDRGCPARCRQGHRACRRYRIWRRTQRARFQSPRSTIKLAPFAVTVISW